MRVAGAVMLRRKAARARRASFRSPRPLSVPAILRQVPHCYGPTAVPSLTLVLVFWTFVHPSVAMALLRAAGLAARTVAAAPTSAAARRTAIVATVAKATDTSAMDFAAPASFDVAASGRRAAKDLRSFFTNGGT